MESGREPPRPGLVRTYDELAERLRALRSWSGASYREVHRRTVRDRTGRGVSEIPAYATVYNCFQPGRRRMDPELVVDVVRALVDDDSAAAEWRQVCQVVDQRAAEASVVDVAAELPADLPHFIGRRTELGRVPAGTETGLVTIHGMPGSGKTTLATHIAQRLAPGSRLFVDLRGHDPERPPADPAAVLGAFLRRLGVRGSEIAPLDLARRTAMYRVLVARCRTLVLLDNAGSEDQVAPLLTDADGCLTLVTSRRRLELPGITQEIALEPFAPAESVELLRRSASGRVDASPQLAGQIADFCGHLPLAVALIAGWMDNRPDWTLSDHLDRLAERRGGLRLDNAVEVALATSYERLPDDDRRLLRLLSLHPGADLDVYAAAALTGGGLSRTSMTLDRLVSASVLRRPTTGRYAMHDLVRIFASDRAREEERPAERRSALLKLYDYYRHSAKCAMVHYAPQDRHRHPEVPAPDTPTPALSDRDSASAWLEAERANLLAVASHASSNGSAQHIVDLSILLFRFLDAAGHHQDAAMVHGLAATIAEPPERARALINLGTACWRLGRYDEALAHNQAALVIHRDMGDRVGEGIALTNLGVSCGRLDRLPEAIEHYRTAIDILATTDDRVTEGVALGNLGYALERSGRLDEALEQNLRHLELARRIDDQAAQGVALGNVGSVYQRLGRLEEALAYHEQALALARQTGYRLGELSILNELAADLHLLGQIDRALETYSLAEDLAGALDNPGELECARAGIERCRQTLDLEP
ncbi:tetratricopeptide repeat protein [Kribbella sp. CA-294648]|uniref:tetratricopeptide repeat protein n=1 Tax=Kribbella sp. CA-294648 TaxID=3239948 RepID=UPI003D92AE55